MPSKILAQQLLIVRRCNGRVKIEEVENIFIQGGPKVRLQLLHYQLKSRVVVTCLYDCCKVEGGHFEHLRN